MLFLYSKFNNNCMKKLYSLLFILFFAAFIANSQTTAVDFTLNDCNGNSQSLYKSLDSGKVMILLYEHQCSSCISGAKLIKGLLNSVYSSNQNVKLIYLDNGGFSCSLISTWISNNSLLQAPTIAYSSDYSSPYGTGMPVLAICGPYKHQVYFKANGLAQVDTAKMHQAIDLALNETILGVQNSKLISNNVNISPNPVTNTHININFSSKVSQKLTLEIIDLTGKCVYTSKDLYLNEGVNNIKLSDAELKNGIYFCSFKTDTGNYVRKLIMNK